MSRAWVVAAALWLAAGAGPLLAQRPWGSRGFSWQPEIRLAQEELAALQADLDRLSDEEWRQRSLAWLEVEAEAEGRVVVSRSWRVADLFFKKKAQIRPLEPQPPTERWEIRFEAKPQRTMALEMTDVDRTRVACPLGKLLAGGGALGVFQHEGVLLCLARQADHPS